MDAETALPLVIVGAGDHARVILDAVRAGGRVPSGFVEISRPATPMDRHVELPILGDLTSDLDWYERIGPASFVVAIGDNEVRARAYERARRLGLTAEAVVHPSAILLGGCAIEPGSQICAAAVIGVNARVGANAIINTAATIDHDNVIGEHASIAPGAHLAGHVTVGAYTHVGIAASVIEGIRIGSRCYVAAGAAVVGEVPDRVRVAGVPARPMATRERTVRRASHDDRR